ncbi:oligopeptide ABC transporter, ATP-binding protein [Thermosipho africanus TCF52B]|jgi:peptide/nickel transport system ATP-binding protein|uniref:Oligopeptide ABC transporter, ATP-binding protein n=1 Tax=Thermosipho africanus (strain TCF52B) TaxID=484019 RepID=B7IHB1_THEAB|nr:ABC transporter ATP-binding protein [Thermosipho africanus]ACJ75475.1 oligopeptide ABC transporter, ATP-binding protein [Thermosipho africanus TCF52B]
MIKVENLKKYFPVKRTVGEVLLRVPQRFVKAVDGVSFSISKGETFGLVGESGSGKTTTGRLILRLIEPTSGKIFFEDTDITKLSKEELRKFRKNMQIIFQDPMAALNPYMKVGDAIKHGLEIHNIGGSNQERKMLVMKMLERVNLSPPEDFYYRYPHELSGGQRQRIVIARALILRPKFVVADEAIAMLDVSVRSQLLKLLIDLKNEFNLTFLFITHDLATTKYICNKIGVMYLGKIVEIGDFKEIYTEPLHPYTKALISAVPEPDPKRKKKKIIPEGEVPNPINPPKGCKFHPRCPYAMDICKETEPSLKKVKNHIVACHLY